MKKNNFYNPTDVRKRKYISSMRNRVLASVMAAITAMTPTVSYAADFEYATTDTTNTANEDIEQHVDNSVEINTSIEDDRTTVSSSDTLKLAEEAEKTGEEAETKFLFINLANAEDGKIILNEGEDSEQQIKLESQNVTDESGENKAEMRINAYDKDGVLISTENAEDNNYIYVYESDKDNVVTVKAVPNDGYEISEYSLQDKLVNGTEEDTGFKETPSSFSFPVFIKENMSLNVSFSIKDDDTKSPNNDLSVNEDKSSSQIDDMSSSVNGSDKASDNIQDNIKEDLTIDNTTEYETPDVNDSTDVDSATATSNENKLESVNESEDAADLDMDYSDNADGDSLEKDNSEQEHFLTAEDDTNVDDLNSDDFISSRLIIITDNEEDIIDTEHLIGNYDNIYLMQYTSSEQAMNAYAYYKDIVEEVEPDAQIITASNDTDDNVDAGMAEIGDDNAIAVLNDKEASETAQSSDKVIALIDAGVSESPNIIDRVSLIDDNVEGGSEHGDLMVEDIVSQNPNAKILSIRALGDNGYGSYSSVVSAIEYAINSKVDIINMSMYTKKSMTTSVVKTEIEKAVDAGITVVGSAGNDGANVRNYIPGCSEAAYVIGACNDTGERIKTSNYGITVNYNVVADSTSEAAAKFTGYISKNGFDNLPDNNLVFDNNYVPDETDSNVDDYKEADNKVDSNLLFLYAMKAYGKDFAGILENTDFADIYNVSDVEMDELKNKISDYFDEDDYELNEYVEKQTLLDENGVNLVDDAGQTEEEKDNDEKKAEEILNNIKISCETAHLWDAAKDGFSENGATIISENGTYTAKLTSGDMSSLISENVKLAPVSQDRDISLDSSEKYSYAWEVLQNATINIYVFPSSAKQEDRRSYFSATLMPESMNFKAAKSLSDVGWNKWTGGQLYTKALGITHNNYMMWLYHHSNYGARNDKEKSYYLKTPYGVLFTWSSGSGAYPAGDKYPKKDYKDANGKVLQTGMNCTAFIWHVFWKSMVSSGNKNTPANYGLGTSRDNTLKGWVSVPNSKNVNHAYFKTKNALIKKGKPKRGDIIWIMAKGEGVVGEYGADNHLLFYWGNGTNDVAWHSTHYTGDSTEKAHSSWCDGTFDGHKNGHKVKTNGNCQSEIASKQPTTYGYVLYRAGGGVPTKVKIKKVNKATGKWDSRLSGTKFALYEGSKKLKEITITSGAETLIDYECLAGHTYTLKETHVNDGWKAAGDISFTVSSDNSAMERPYTISNEEKPKPATLKIGKRIGNWKLASASSRIGKVDAIFTVYSNAACTKAVKTCHVTGNDSNAWGSVSLEAGTYYVKETTQISGTIDNRNTKYGPLTLKAGESKSLADLIPSSQYNALNINTNSKEVMNYPTMFRGKLLTKVDKNTKAPIAGAVFKVLYSEWGNTKWNTARTWYFVTDENGEIKYDRDHLADNNSKFKDKYKSSDMFVYDWNDDTKTALPPCNLRIQEVEAPDGYVLDNAWYSEWTQTKSNTDVNLKMDKNLVIEEDETKNEWRLQANVKKVDADGNGLANAVFGIWDDEEKAKKNAFPLARVKTDENGISNTYQMTEINKDTDSVTLYCKELSAPDGYVKSDTVYPLTYTQDKYNELYKEDHDTKGELQTFGGEEGIINKTPGWYVSGFAKKITKTGDTLAGATFGIYGNEDCDEYSLLTTVTSGEDGVTNIGTIGVSENKDEITLYLKEIDAPEGYAATDEVFSQTWHKENYKTADIATGEVKQFGPEDGIVNDDGWRVNVFAKKVNPQGRALAGAEFGIYADKELSNKVGTLISGKDGVTNTLTVTRKTSENTVTLWCQEEKAPNGCVPVNAVYDVTFDKSDYDAIVADTGSFLGETKQFGPEEGIVNDDPWKIRFKAKKVDAEGTTLEGATFAVYDDEECKNQIATLSSGEDGFTNEETFTVNADETSKTLYCKEIGAPDGYKLNTEVFKLTWDKDDYRDKKDEDENFVGETKLFGGENGIVNKIQGIPWKFRCQAKKIAIDGSPLDNARFGVYTDPECTDNNQIGVLESAEDGMTNVLDINVDADTETKTVYCKEIKAPDGYDLLNQTFSLTFTAAAYRQELNNGNSDGQLKMFGPEDGSGIVNRPTKPVNVKIHKTSTAPSEIFDLSGYNLKGATFEITGDNGYSGVLTTDADGNTPSLDLPNEDATYTIEEREAPAGHEINDSKTFEVKMPDDASKDIEIEFSDEPAFAGGEFKIEKNSTKGNSIKGVVFKVEFFDGNDTNTTPKKIWYLVSDKDGIVTMDDAHISTDSAFVSDSFYKYNNEVVIPVGGTLRITEVKAPAEYILDSTPKIIETSDDIALDGELGEITNDLVPCKIQLKKYDEDGKTTLAGVKFRLEFLEESESSQKVGEVTPTPIPDIDNTEKAEQIPDTDESGSSSDDETENPDIEEPEPTPVVDESGVGSGGDDKEEDKVYPYVRLLKVGESIEAETDANGEITWENLDQGRYRITEIETTTGHTLLKDPIYITLPITMTDKDAKAMSAATDQGVFDSGYSNKWYFYEATFEVTNNAKFIMPMTGDNGFWKFGFIGFGTIVVLGAGLVIFDKKGKKQKYRKRVTKK